MRSRILWGYRGYRAGALALVVALAVAACARQDAPAAPDSRQLEVTHTVQDSASTAPTPAEISPMVVVHISGEAHDVRLSGDVMWVPEFTGTELVLLEFSTAGKPIKQVRLGGSSSSGVNSHLRVAPDGSVWVSDDYTLYRFDPDSGAVRDVHLAV